MSRNYVAHYAFGGGALDGKALANGLRAQGYPTPTIDFASSGGGAYTTGGKGLLLGVEGHAIVDQDAGVGYESALGLGYMLFNAGYRLRLGPLHLYPLIGAGAGGLGLDISDRPAPSEVADVPVRETVRLALSNFLMNLGIGVELHIGGRYGLSIGIQTGYIFSPFTRREGIRGPYFRVMIGGSWRGREPHD